MHHGFGLHFLFDLISKFAIEFFDIIFWHYFHALVYDGTWSVAIPWEFPDFLGERANGVPLLHLNVLIYSQKIYDKLGNIVIAFGFSTTVRAIFVVLVHVQSQGDDLSDDVRVYCFLWQEGEEGYYLQLRAYQYFRHLFTGWFVHDSMLHRSQNQHIQASWIFLQEQS